METLLEQEVLKYSLENTPYEHRQVGVIYSLSIEEADSLKVLDNNRSLNSIPSKNHIRSLVRSFVQKGYLKIPIIVNEHMEVVDGQHRKRAWEMYCNEYPDNKFDLLFIALPNFDARAAQALNTTPSKKWTSIDYIDAYKHENKNYKIVSNFIEKYQLEPVASLLLLSGRSVRFDGKEFKNFRNGDFIVNPEVMSHANQLAGIITSVFNDFPRYKTDKFVNAYVRFQAHPKYNQERFLANWPIFWKDALNGRASEESLKVGLFEIQNGDDKKGSVKINHKTLTIS